MNLMREKMRGIGSTRTMKWTKVVKFDFKSEVDEKQGDVSCFTGIMLL